MKISARLSLSGPVLTRGRMLLVVAGFAALSVAVVPWVVIAATQTWTGGGAGGSGWASPNNWNSGAGPSPSNGDDVVLAQVQGNPPNNFDINVTLNSITLNTPLQGIVAIANAGGFVLGLQNGGFITDNSTSGPDAINTGITLNGPATFTVSAGATGLSFGVNPITGTGGLTLVNNSGDDALLLNLANTYTGATAVNGTGRVKANVKGAIPTSSALTVNGSALFQETSTSSRFAVSTTNALGVAVAPALTANGQSGLYSMNATVPGAGTTTFNLTNDPVPVGGAYCSTDTTQADFEAGVATNTDVVSSPGNVILSANIDQQNLTLGNGGNGFGGGTWMGQTFVPSITGQLARADINLLCGSCTGTTPTVTVSVRATAAGLPTGADLAAATFPTSTSNAPGYFTANFASPATLTAGTTYALVIRNATDPSLGSNFLVTSNTNVYAAGARVESGNSGANWTAQTTDIGFITYMKTGLAASGDFVSSLKDSNPLVPGSTIWSTLAWNATVLAPTTLQFQVGASNSFGGPFNFVGPDSTAGTFFTNGTSLAQFNGFRYLKYKAFFTTSDNTETPTLHDVTVCYNNATPPNVFGTKTKSGGNTTGSSGSYTVVLSNTGGVVQADNSGDEFTDTLPSSLTLVSANATSGTATTGANTVSWNGSIAGSGSVTITITATINSVPDGTIVSNQGSISYDADANGTNEASRLTDDPSVSGASNPTNFTVNDVNDPPDAVNDPLSSVAEDSGLRTIPIASLLANDTRGPANESGQTLSLSLVSGSGVGGTISNDATNVYFTPAADFSGAASFQYTVTDNGTTNGAPDPKSDTATVSFTITEVNDAPAAVSDELADVAEDSGDRTIPFAVLTANDSKGPADESGQTLVFKTVSNAVGGTVSIVGGNVIFTPAADYYGGASFQYTVEDNGTTNGAADPKTSAPATVSFTITEVNDAPTAVNDTLSNVAEDSGPRTIPFATLTANDSKGPANESAQTLSIKTVSNPVGGTVSIVGGNVLFTPTANYYGAASFQYTVEDNGTTNGAADPKTSGLATVSFNITAVADTPSVTNATTNANTQTTSGLVISRNPADGAEVTHFRVTGITGGTLFKNNGTTVINNGDFITFAEGNAGLKFTPGTTNGSFTVQASLSASDAGLGGGTATATIIVNAVGGVIRFSAANYSVAEGAGFKTITVERTGDTSQPATVDYASSDHSNPADFIPCTAAGPGFASSRCDFTTAVGTLRFAAGETSKTFDVLISQDNYVEGTETLELTLSNLTGGAVFGVPSTAILSITDDATEGATNPIDTSSEFVRSQYHDFLHREPDAPGLAFWTDNIEKCNDGARRPAGQTVAQCIDKQREATAVAFFMSPEFQITGGFVYRLYKGSLTGVPNYDGGSPGRFPTSLEFMRDVSTVSEGIVVNNQISGAVVEANRNRLAAEFVQRPEFLAKYGGLDNTLYVLELFNTTGVVATAGEKQTLIDGLINGMETRASVLRRIVDGTVVLSESNVQFTTTYGEAFYNQENRRVFVFMEYVGYLRRNPDAAGFVFWLGKLNQYNGDPFQAEMVRSFILSPEYRSRFGQP